VGDFKQTSVGAGEEPNPCVRDAADQRVKEPEYLPGPAKVSLGSLFEAFERRMRSGNESGVSLH